VLCLLGATAAAPALAGGFANATHSATAGSTATAGVTAEGVDASTVLYNPAGISLLRRPEIGAATAVIYPNVRFRDGSAVDATNQPVGGSGDTRNELLLLPSVYGVLPLDRLTLGFGANVPFGQSSKYDPTWIGRYHTYETALSTVEIGPSVAYRVTDAVAIGGGVGVQYARFTRKNAVDFGSVCFGSLGPGACAGLGLLPQRADGNSDVDLDDWSVRFSLGTLVEPRQGTHLGLVYRSPTRHKLSGSAEFAVPAAAAPLTAGGAFRDTAASASITFPESISAGFAQQLTASMTLLGDLTWTRWSRLQQLTLDFENPAQPALSQTLDWHDTWRAALGVAYQFTDSTMVRTGIAYDQSPIRNAFRTPDLPGSDRVELGIGLLHRFGALLCGLSYTYRRDLDASVHATMTGAGTVAGEFEKDSHALGLQIGMTF
jgi:long-chain fatty acid transport protein